MSMSPRLDRRRALGLLAAAALAPGPTKAQDANAGFDIVILADLHSAYERMAQVLAAIDGLIRAAPAIPRLIVINGDVFEGGNVVAARSGGAVEGAFLDALVRRAPVVLNLGNHEADLTLDLAVSVREAQARGITVLTNIVDARTGRPYAAAATKVELGEQIIALQALAVAKAETYPREVRPNLTIPDPVAWARAHLRRVPDPGTFDLVLSHAGVQADKGILPLLADGTLLVGGHDHLTFEHRQGRTRYVHTGSWNRGFGIASVRGIGPERTIALRQVDVALDAPADADLAARIAAAERAHLTEAERQVVGHPRAALGLGETGREIARLLAVAQGGDVGLIGHTTLGTGFPAPDLTRFAYDAVIRFEGDLVMAEVEAETLASIDALANQDRDLPLESRLGDFVYANLVKVEPGRRYRLVTNDWTARNQQTYLGRSDLRFVSLAGAKLKPTVLSALRG